jgi:sporulation protein YlmC with PRC-barrel domain
MTRTSLMAAAATLALLTAPALAQTTSPGGARPSPGSLAAPAAAPSRPTPNPLMQSDVSQIKGSAVYGTDGKKIGTIATELMTPDSHKIDRLVVGAGGVLGVGAHDVSLPISDFHWDAQKGGFTLSRTEAELKSMPAWNGSGDHMSGSSVPPTDKQ